jgi:hypothetical protein
MIPHRPGTIAVVGEPVGVGVEVGGDDPGPRTEQLGPWPISTLEITVRSPRRGIDAVQKILEYVPSSAVPPDSVATPAGR